MSNTTTLAERLEQAGNSAAQSWIITELLLNAYPATIRQSVIAAAVPHWFTVEILAALLDLSMEDAEERYVALQQLSIVQPFGDLGHTLHDLTRSGILSYLAANAIEELRKYSQRVHAYLSNQPAAQDSQTEVESVYHQLIFNIDEGRSALKKRSGGYRNNGNFAAVENLLRNYREVMELGLLEPTDQVELERQEYWAGEALVYRGKQEKDEQGTQYLRKALEQFAPPEQLPVVLANQPEKWREQIDIYKRDFVLNQLENVRSAGDLARQSFWLVELGNIYLSQGDLETSLQQLDNALVLAPEDARAWAYRGATKHRMAHYEDALADFSRAIELDDKYDSAIAGRGQVYRSLKRYKEALIDFDHVITLDENQAWAFACRGETYRVMELYEEALADFNRAVTLDEKSAWVFVSRGQVYGALKRHEQALADFNRAIALDNKIVWAFANRGETYHLMQRYDEALIDFTRAIQLDANHSWVIAYRGLTYGLMARYNEALADFDRILELDAKDTWTINRRGDTYRQMERYDEALENYTRTITLDEKNTWAFAFRGETYRLMKRYKEALADFDRAIQLDDKDAWTFASRGDVYQALTRYTEALADFDRAIMLNDNSAWAITDRGYIYLLLNRASEAHADLSRVLTIEETNWRFYCRGLSYLVQNQLTEAQSDLTRAIELAMPDYVQDPHDWRNTFNLMLYHMVAGDNSMAERFLLEALDGNAPVPRLKAAIQDLEELLMVLPDHPQARIFLQRIEAHLASLTQPEMGKERTDDE